MKSLREYITEAEQIFDTPQVGDNFAISCREECLLETYVCDQTEDGIVLHADDKIMRALEAYGYLSEEELSPLSLEENFDDVASQDAGEYDYEGDSVKDDLETVIRAARRLTGMLRDNDNVPEWVQSKVTKAADYVDTAADYLESNQDEEHMDEAKYQGREVPLGKPMKGDVKKSKVYVRGPKGNVVKVNIGQKGMKIKKNIPGRRKNFRARHNCDNPGPRWKARYWSCRAW